MEAINNASGRSQLPRRAPAPAARRRLLPDSEHGAFGTYWFHLLPYLEQGNLYRSSLGSVPFPPPDGPTAVYYPGNDNVYSQRVAVFLARRTRASTSGVLTVDGVSWARPATRSTAW